MLLAFDPSICSPGVAVFATETLVAATRLTVDTGARNMGFRCYAVAQAVVEWLPEAWRIRRLVIEWPQAYTVRKSKGDHNELFGLAGTAMALGGMLGTAPEAYRPAEWCQQTKKKTSGKVWTSPRAKRVESRLSDTELEVYESVKKWHDAIDAIGLGLFALGRFAPRRVFPGAT